MPLPDRIPRWFDALWLTLLAAYILAGAAIAPFHGDESTLIFMGRDFHYLFVEGDLSQVMYDDTWSTRPTEQKLRLENGTISKTIYGWLAWNQGFALDDFNRPWSWGHDYETNLRRNNVPDAQLLKAARMASAIQLALAGAIFFQFARITLNRPTAYVATALLVMHPNVLINGRRAMMEGSHLLGLTLVLLAGALLLRERHWRNYLLLGLCMGLAISAKHPNVLAAALVVLAVAIANCWQSRPKNKRSFVGAWRPTVWLLPLLIAAALAFLLLNPAWWSAPFELPSVIIEIRSSLLQSQAAAYNGYDSFLERLQGLFHIAFAAEHQYFEVAHWSEYDVITEQIRTYESSGLAGFLIGGSSLVGFVCLLLAGYGAYSIARDSVVGADNRILLLVWAIGTALLTLLLTPVPWARYYLPLAPALAVLVARALVDLYSAMLLRFRRGADGLVVLD
ncbi:MAG: phospholipid carrier-dependent glycosyltransferase [Chloroflexi bacterium]|nr:phospholipid carrier-dependent glycosyltransferase [Chloroflexota bacterium]